MSERNVTEKSETVRTTESPSRRPAAMRVRTGCRAGCCFPGVEYDFTPN